jgi:G3E family GTPase
MPQTPILLITGFLGSGKTTFINWLLETNPNKNISLILNEFGAVKLESQFISQKDGVEIAELANGCMCCVAKSDIPRVINHILQNAPQTEQIVIEASGLSDPDPILASLRGPELAQKVKLDAVVCVIDCLNFLETSKEHSIVMSQVGDADIVVLNKINEADPQVVQTIEQSIKRIGINTTVLRWDEQLSSEFFFDPQIETHHHDDGQHSHEHHHDHYDEVWFSSDKNIDITKLSEIIRTLPSNIIRSKGFANWNGQKVMIQFVAGRADFLEANWGQDVPSTNILFLGTNIKKDDLLNQLKTCEIIP